MSRLTEDDKIALSEAARKPVEEVPPLPQLTPQQYVEFATEASRWAAVKPFNPFVGDKGRL